MFSQPFHVTHQVYEEVTARRTYTGYCPVCGGKTAKSRTFAQTVNPFNKGADGLPRTRSEVQEMVTAEADSWSPDFRHLRCMGLQK